MTRYQRRQRVMLLAGLGCLGCAGLLMWLIVATWAGPGTGAVSPVMPSPSPMRAELPARGAVVTGTHEVTVSLPIALREFSVTPPPYTGTVTIYDCDGAITTTEWLESYFGNVTWTGPVTATAQLTALRAACYDAPAVLVAHTTYGGMPLEGVTVVINWATAPWLPAELYGCGFMRGVYGPTNGGGDIGFGMGRGAFYDPAQGEVGPHTIWIGEQTSVCLSGLGMVAGTNHHHLDSSWALDGAGMEAVHDWGFTPGAAVYPVEHNGMTMWVVQGP